MNAGDLMVDIEAGELVTVVSRRDRWVAVRNVRNGALSVVAATSLDEPDDNVFAGFASAVPASLAAWLALLGWWFA